MKILLPYWQRFASHKLSLYTGILCVPLVVCFDILLSVKIGNALTRLRAGDDASFLRGLFFLLLVIAAFQGVFRFLQRRLIVGVSRRFEVELKQDLFDQLTRLSYAWHGKARSGDLVSRLTADVENIRMLLGPGCMYVLSFLVMAPGCFIVLFRISPSVTVAMMVPLSLVVWSMKKLTPRLHRLSTSVQESLAEVSHLSQENFSGVRIAKGYGLAEHESARFSAASFENRTHQVNLGRARGLTNSFIHLSYDLSFLPILLVGGWAMIDSQIEVGDLFKFIDLGFKVFWPVIALGWIMGLYPRALASAERVQAILDDTQKIDDSGSRSGADRPTVRGSLSLKDVGYSYEGSRDPALTGINLEVPAGSILGVVGPTGSGKSTLLNLLGRLYEPDGELRLDGIEVRELPLDELRGALGYVPQDSFMFSDTYRANIEFGADEPPFDDSALWGLIDLAAMRREVEELPRKLDQLIGERGVSLSGGQRQRSCIARALAKDPRILVLDDALSAVDTETEARLFHSLREAGRGRTVVVSAHRLATVHGADQILVLKDGCPEALGTHAEVLARSEWYRETWERQRMAAELEEL
ncbi:MAG: ATP-binding cassette subfamily B multidrug efflux pump [Planctomycetota bacterium]